MKSFDTSEWSDSKVNIIFRFKILDHRGEVAYQLELPQSLAGVHDVFHVSQLKKYLRVPEEQAPLNSIELKEDLIYKEQPIKILDVAERRTRSKTVCFCKVQWSNHSEGEATWEREEELKAEFPSLFFTFPRCFSF